MGGVTRPDTSDGAISIPPFFKENMTIDELTELQMLNDCAWECTVQSRWKESTQRYIANMLIKNLELQDDLKKGRYSVRPTTDFYLNERGHIRKIEAPNVHDRVVHKSLTKNIIIPSLRPYVIYDNYASLTDRGTSFARKRLEIMLRRYITHYGTDGYILLIDIRKYFENVDHDVLKSLIAPRISNQPEDVIGLLHYIIDTSSKTYKGLNLGGEPPQMFAVYYLNPVDQYIKVVKGVKYYGRYMDDMAIICRTKQEAIALLSEIEAQLALLRLGINKEKTQIVKLTHGFTFLQIKYSIMPTGKILKRPSRSKVVRERRRLKAFRRRYDEGDLKEPDIWNAYKSWRGTLVREHNACHKTLIRMDKLYHSLFPMHVEPDKKVKPSRCAIVEMAYKEAESEFLYHIV